MPPPSREERKAAEARDAEKRELLAIIEGADEKISDLESELRTFVVENAEAIFRNPDLNVGDTIFNQRIDEIVSQMWRVLRRLAALMPNSTSDEPSIWRKDASRPAICYGPEKYSALPIIESLKGHFAEDEALRHLLCDLVQITGNHHRELRVMPPEVGLIINRRPISKPEPEDFSIGFVAHQDADVQRALVETGKVIFSNPNSIGPFLGETLSQLRDRVEVI